MTDNAHHSPYDKSFWSLLTTQLLGAFNDNVYKMLVLLLCADRIKADPLDDWQGPATIAFAAPFVLFSGACGYLGDRFSKSRIIVLSKVLEIVVMGAGLLVFWALPPSRTQLSLLIGVLFLMGAHSTLFGPAKYGILPELWDRSWLPKINGWMLMTTFLAIIGGTATAGILRDTLPSLTVSQSVCVLIAVVGTLTVLPMRSTPVAQPDLKFRSSTLFIDPEARTALREHSKLRTALLYSSIFWFVGGVFMQVVNTMGTRQYGLTDTQKGQLAATTSIGIAMGSVLAGALSKARFRAGLVRIAGGGLALTLGLIGLPGPLSPDGGGIVERLPWFPLWGMAVLLTLAGLFAGLFAIPLQVYLQAMSPEHLKGRMIGAMNLINWIGIILSGAFYHFANRMTVKFQSGANTTFAAVALIVLIATLGFRMRDEPLDAVPPTDP